MFRFKEYVLAESLEQAYELNQKKNNTILGGMLWLKMEDINRQTAIDLSGLALNQIEEDGEQFTIGCMATLRDLELHPALNGYFNGAFKACTRHIVGTQFRNLATVGGSIYGRFGFSEILTLMMALDSYVELYQGGILPLARFAEMKKDNDILVRVIIKKDLRKAVYLCERLSASDFPLISCCVFRQDASYGAVLGARPKRAKLFLDESGFLASGADEQAASQFAKNVRERADFGTNMRAGADYRQHLAEVLIKRGIKALAVSEEAEADEN